MNFIKKLSVLTIVSALTLSSVYADSEYKTAPAFVRITTNMLGYNFIAKKVAQGVLKKTLKKSMAGEYKVKFDSFSGVDLKKGKFRGLTIDGKNLSVEDELYISKLHMETTSDFNYVDYRKDPMVFKTDVPFKFNVETTESDLNKTLTIGKTFELISSLIPLVKIEKPVIKLENQKIRMSSSLKFPLAKPVKFSMSAGLKVADGKIVLSDLTTTGSQKDMAQKFVDILNKQDFLENINLNLFDDTDTIVKVENVDIKDKTIYVNGQFIIKKSN